MCLNYYHDSLTLKKRFVGNAVVERIITLIDQCCALTIRRLTDPAIDDAK